MASADGRYNLMGKLYIKTNVGATRSKKVRETTCNTAIHHVVFSMRSCYGVSHVAAVNKARSLTLIVSEARVTHVSVMMRRSSISGSCDPPVRCRDVRTRRTQDRRDVTQPWLMKRAAQAPGTPSKVMSKVSTPSAHNMTGLPQGRHISRLNLTQPTTRLATVRGPGFCGWYNFVGGSQKALFDNTICVF